MTGAGYICVLFAGALLAAADGALMHSRNPNAIPRYRGELRGRSLIDATPSTPITPITGGVCQQVDYIYNGQTPQSIFDALSPQEGLDVAALMVDELDMIFPYGLGQSDATNATGKMETQPQIGDSYIYSIWKFPTDKAEALDYLDNGGPEPKRFAKAIAVRGAASPPDVMAYKIGPLPLDEDSTIEELYAPGHINYAKRPKSDLGDRAVKNNFTDQISTVLKPLFQAIVGQCAATDDTECTTDASGKKLPGSIASFTNPAPFREIDGTTRISLVWHYWTPGYGNASGSVDELHVLPVAYKVNQTSLNWLEWEAYEFEHCGQGFDTAEALMEAFHDGSLTVCAALQWNSPTYNDLWADTVHQGGVREGSTKPGPRQYEPMGKRYTLKQGDSPTSRVVNWMGWQFHVTVDPWTGISFHDVRFKSERILYELSLNDQFVAYSGWETIGQAFYYDGTYALGADSVTLKPGYDCPETATYMDVNLMGPFGMLVHYKGGVCMFEESMSTSTWRHFDEDKEGNPRVRQARAYEFVVRTIATIGNYDYMYDVRYQLDGEVRVVVSMAGYMQAAFFDSDNKLTEKDRRFGTVVNKNTLGNIHDHLTSWKVDLDVNGTANTFHKDTVRAGTYEEIFGETPVWAQSFDTFKYNTDEVIETEAGYKLNYSEPTTFRIVNENTTNALGNARSYGIIFTGTAPQLLPASNPLVKAAAWTKYNVAVTQRKEEEPTSSTPIFDAHSPNAPIYSLDMALDGENIVDTDLVAWVSMGVLHVPRQEDVPLISNIGSEFQLKPINYFSQLATLDVYDSDDFEPCMPEQGMQMYNYSWSRAGDSEVYNKASFTFKLSDVSSM